MSLRATGVLSHALPDFEQVAQLPVRLEVCTKLAMRVAEEYWGKSIAHASCGWDVTEWGPPGKATPEAQWDSRQGPMIRGPGDTWIVFGQRCLFINTIAKWRVTCVRPSLLEAVWALIAAIGGVVGKTKRVKILLAII